jgi:RNA polymerase sigma-70 factor (ECF subfamily)
LRAFEKISSFRLEGSFVGWLNRIAARMYIHCWRVESRFNFDPASVEEFELPDLRAVNVADVLYLDLALPLLWATERVCVTLCVGVGLTHPEAADELGIPLGTVKSHVHRGLVKLRTHFACAADQEAPKRVRA